jgi:hypothetical protein
MKSNSPESAILRSDAGAPDRTRRTLAEATTQLGQAVGEVITGSLEALGGRRQGGGRTQSGSAASTTNRLREIIERDRALVAQQTVAEVASARAQEQQRANAERDVSATAARRDDHQQLAASAQQVARTHGSPTGAAGEAQAKSAREPKPRSAIRVPPPPLPSRAVPTISCPPEDTDDDDELSVHDEPTRVGPPPGLVAERPLDHNAAAAASAFGSDTCADAPSTSSRAAERAIETRASARERSDEVRRAGQPAERKRIPTEPTADSRSHAAPRTSASAEPKPQAPGASAKAKSASKAALPGAVSASAKAESEDETLLPREPIRTLTMARLLASQGHLRRALSIYDELLVKTPDDLALISEVESLRALKD